MTIQEIKKNEDIILPSNELAMESDPEFKKEDDDRSLAVEESDGGFKHKIEEENAEDLHEDASHSQYDITKDEDIILRFDELAIESDPEFKKERDDRSLADEESNGEFKHKIEEENAEDLGESNRSDLAECHEAKTRKMKQEGEIDLSDSGLGTLEVLERIVLEYHEFVEHALEMFKDGQEKKEEDVQENCWRVLLQASSRLNKGYERVNNEIECLKKKDENETEESYYNKRPYITTIFSQLEDVNSTFYSCVEESSCVHKLNQCKEELGKCMLRIRELKANKIEELEKEMEELKIEDKDETEELKQRCVGNDSGCCSVPQLPDGFEK